MPLPTQLKQYWPSRLFRSRRETDVLTAYNLWADSYDQQPDNLILALDESLLSKLLTPEIVAGKRVADVGCGTGRHWNRIFDMNPQQLCGFDVSPGMLNILNKKFPGAETFLIKDNSLQPLKNNSCNLVLSTLALAHIENMKDALAEWNRVLSPGGQIIITDYHPETLKRGGNRTFRHGNKLIAVKNYIHPISQVKDIATVLGWQLVSFTELKIDASVKHYYEKANALHIYKQFENTPVIYGMHLIKSHAAS